MTPRTLEERFGADERNLAGEVLFADVLLLPNGMSKVGFIA